MSNKVCFISHPYHRGGVTSWTIDMVNHLSANESVAPIVCPEPTVEFISGGGRSTIVDLLDKRGYHPKVGRSYELGTMEYKASVLAENILKHIPAGTVLIPSDDEACWMACSMVADKYPVIGVLHSDDTVYYELYYKYKPYLTGLVTVSQRILDNTKQVTTPAAVIPCGIIPPKVTIGEKVNKILWVGRLEERQKRASDIIAIAKTLKQQNSDFVIEVWGNGESLPTLTAAVTQEQLQEEVILKGWSSREELLQSLAEAKVLLQTSNFEGMSVAVMEALYCGCAIVSTKVSGIEDYAKLPEASEIIKLYDIGDTVQGAAQLDKTLKNFKAEFVETTQQLAKQHFSIAVCNKFYQDFINQFTFVPKPTIKMPNTKQKASSVVLAKMRYLKYRLK